MQGEIKIWFSRLLGYINVQTSIHHRWILWIRPIRIRSSLCIDIMSIITLDNTPLFLLKILVHPLN